MLEHGEKIKGLDELAQILQENQIEENRKKVVYCHGVFDLLHIGHIRYLQQAKQLGDILVVTLTQDQYVNKGPHRPAFTETLRAESLAALSCVNYVAVNRWPTAVDTIKALKPDIYAKGAEFKEKPTPELLKEQDALREIGGEMVFIEDITSSSSYLINRYLDLFSQEVKNYLGELRQRYSVDEILGYLKELHSLKVLIVGEAIIDEYQFCQSIGKASKEPTLVAKLTSSEMYPGGVLAISNHIANFCDQVGVLSFLGTEDSYEEFIQKHIKKNIKKVFLYKENTPTIVKRRFVDDYLLSKLFETYTIDDRNLNETENRVFCDSLEKFLLDYDAVIVADYGHGMLSKQAIEILTKKSKFLAINAQINAGNRGFNTIMRYPQADYICLNESELRLELRDQNKSIKKLVMDISRKFSKSKIMITRGKNGTLIYDQEEGFVETPAFASKVVDRVGAGDAVLALTSLLMAINVPLELIGFIGNVVGAQAVSVVGNRTSVEPDSLKRSIFSLLR